MVETSAVALTGIDSSGASSSCSASSEAGCTRASCNRRCTEPSDLLYSQRRTEVSVDGEGRTVEAVTVVEQGELHALQHVQIEK